MAKKNCTQGFPNELYMAYQNIGTEEQYPVTGISEADVFNGMDSPLNDRVKIAYYKLVNVKTVEAKLHETQKDK